MTIDDELFYYWISFAQKVAASLERAEQRVQGDDLTKIGAKHAVSSQRILDQDVDPKKVLEDFATEIQQLLGASYCHLRVRVGRQQEYELIASNSEIGKLHRQVRPILPKDSGSCRQSLLDSDEGTFINIGGNPSGFAKVATTTSAISTEEQALHKAAKSFESFGVVPLMRQNDLIGSLVLESDQKYFTDYRRAIVRAAAREAEQILLEYESRRQADRLHALRQLIVEPLIHVSELGAA